MLAAHHGVLDVRAQERTARECHVRQERSVRAGGGMTIAGATVKTAKGGVHGGDGGTEIIPGSKEFTRRPPGPRVSKDNDCVHATRRR